MAINGVFLKSLYERFAPELKKGAKTVDCPQKIHFSPSDLSKEVLDEINSSKEELTEVAPFADKLIHPDLFGLASPVNRTKAIVRNSEHLISNLKDEKLRGVFNTLYSRTLVHSKNIERDSNYITDLAQKVDMIDNPQVKDKMLFSIDVLNGRDDKSFKGYFETSLEYVEDFADAINSLEGKYFSRNNSAQKFYKWMDKRGVWVADVIDGTKKSEECYRDKLISTNQRTKKYDRYLRDFDKLDKKGISQTFENNLRLDAMRKFIAGYSKTRRQSVSILYNDYYLKTLPPEIAKECTDILNEYNTYIICSNADITVKDFKFVKEELKRWQEAGKGDEKLPEVLDVNVLDEYLLRQKASGCAYIFDDRIAVRELLEYDGKYQKGQTLRHEIQHLQDEEAKNPKGRVKRLKNKLAWKYNKMVHKKEWLKELEKAGISVKEHREYALTDEAELMSVTAESDMNRLNQKFKDDMSGKYKMKKWIFNVKDNEIAQECKKQDKLEQAAKEAKS